MRYLYLPIIMLLVLVFPAKSEGLFCCNYDGCSREGIVIGGSASYLFSGLADELYDFVDCYVRNPSLLTTGFPENKQSDLPLALNAYIGQHFVPWANITLGYEFGYKWLGKIRRTISGNFTGFDIKPYQELRSQGFDLLLLAKYTHCTGINLFIKVGGIGLATRLKQNNLISVNNPALAGMDYLGKHSDTFYNLAPELIVGVGFMINNCTNFMIIYDHIHSAFDYKNYGEVGTPGPIQGAPSYDMIGIGIERLF